MKYLPSGKTIKKRCTSVKAWELPKQESALAPDYVWTNSDMDPGEHETDIQSYTPQSRLM